MIGRHVSWTRVAKFTYSNFDSLEEEDKRSKSKMKHTVEIKLLELSKRPIWLKIIN